MRRVSIKFPRWKINLQPPQILWNSWSVVDAESDRHGFTIRQVSGWTKWRRNVSTEIADKSLLCLGCYTSSVDFKCSGLAVLCDLGLLAIHGRRYIANWYSVLACVSPPHFRVGDTDLEKPPGFSGSVWYDDCVRFFTDFLKIFWEHYRFFISIICAAASDFSSRGIATALPKTNRPPVKLGKQAANKTWR
jgi:hypothetical protein